jgi:ATP-dependent Clp protease adaptor protein ClpS
MTSLLRRLHTRLSKHWDDFLIAKYVFAVEEYARREGFLPVTVQTLARFAIFGRPTQKVRALLAAYGVKINATALNVAATERSEALNQSLEIAARAYHMSRSSRGSRIVDAGDVLVCLARHHASAAIIERLGLTELQITYFLSHGRTLPTTRDDELEDLPQRAGDVFVRVSNDDYTPMELVTKILADVFRLDAAQARDTMLRVHHQRKAFLGPYAYEEARATVAKATAMAREAGAPLLLSLARDAPAV